LALPRIRTNLFIAYHIVRAELKVIHHQATPRCFDITNLRSCANDRCLLRWIILKQKNFYFDPEPQLDCAQAIIWTASHG
jgi:hypothetical protein